MLARQGVREEVEEVKWLWQTSKQSSTVNTSESGIAKMFKEKEMKKFSDIFKKEVQDLRDSVPRFSTIVFA